MTDDTIRTIKPYEYDAFLELLDQAYGNFHSAVETKRQISSKFFRPDNCFVAVGHEKITGSVAVTKLPRERWFVLRYLALRDGRANDSLGRRLVKEGLETAKSQNAEYLRSTTPRIEPYIRIYEGEDFRPVRRDFRIRWKLPITNVSSRQSKNIKLQDVTEYTVDLASEVFMKSIENIWDWRTAEQRGPENVRHNFKEGLKGSTQKWKLVFDKDDVIGLTGLMPNDGGIGNARFRGAYVLPEHRGSGYGMAIMEAVFDWAWKLAQDEMVIYTFSPLNQLAPGASLYLKSGGKVDSEYLQLEKMVP